MTMLPRFEDLSGLNNMSLFPMYRRANEGKVAFEDFFGFIQSEMDEVLSILKMEKWKEDFKLAYNGYLTGSGIRLYCPYSVLTTVSTWTNKMLLSSWVDSNSSGVFVAGTLISQYPMWPQILERLLQLQKAKLGTADARFRGLIPKGSNMNNLTKSEDALWTYLYYTGYLTAVPHKGQDCSELRSNKPNIVVDFFIPNEEVLSAWRTFFDEAMFGDEEGPTIREDFASMMETLAVGQLEEMARLMKKIWQSLSIWNEPSFADGAGKEKEYWYHRLLSMVFSTYMDGHFTVSSCVEVGRGEVDIALLPCPTRTSYNPIVLEFKQLYKAHTPIEKRDEMLATKVKKGCEQTANKKYSEIPTFSPYMKQHQIVVAFCGKECEVRYRTIERVSRDDRFVDSPWLPEEHKMNEPSEIRNCVASGSSALNADQTPRPPT